MSEFTFKLPEQILTKKERFWILEGKQITQIYMTKPQ